MGTIKEYRKGPMAGCKVALDNDVFVQFWEVDPDGPEVERLFFTLLPAHIPHLQELLVKLKSAPADQVTEEQLQTINTEVDQSTLETDGEDEEGIEFVLLSGEAVFGSLLAYCADVRRAAENRRKQAKGYKEKAFETGLVTAIDGFIKAVETRRIEWDDTYATVDELSPIASDDTE